ncbi:MAG: DUF1553 domain-containing protein, partial [Planctomycetia bacterium]|nr:DUF1553 domain-containing protein [Planctomycetia bacterium]
KLTDEQKEILKRWIAEGANFEEHWAFVAPKRPEIPKIDGVSNPIDAFIRSKLAEAKLKSSAPADKVTLIRRVTLDLIGLPPTPEEVDAFVKDDSPNAYEKLLDRLFASPHYGERMALPWLDAARYADSNGFQQDGDTFQWVWRDWVVKALNDNMPFDQFTVEQLAGDLLPNATLDQKIATAFNRNHLVNGEGGAIPEEQRFNNLFDRVDTTATNWLGLTMACAQCHDHKYDPITQKDYYSLMAAFNNVSESGVAGRQSSKMRVSPPFLEAPTAEHKATLASLEAVVSGLKTALAEKRKLWERREKPDEKRKVEFETKVEPGLVAMLRAAEKELADFRADELPKVMVMADDRPRETHILDRGEYLKKKELVSFATPAFLPPLPKDAPKNRLGLARWLVSPEHPLTARVAVNRAWQTFFGAGLVRTSEDFGVQSEVPIHRDLLDWLAVEFRESGWDMKKLHRLIVTSETYKQSSKVTAEHRSIDPENRYLARFPRVRLPAMILRDVALAAGGLLDRRIGGKPVYPYQPDGIWETLAITKERDFTYPKSGINDLHRRSLYTFWRRTVGPANMFDASTRQVCKVKPSVTNTPLHALTTLNDPTWTEAARGLAERTLAKEEPARIEFAFRQVLSRTPTERERTILQSMLAKQREAFRKDAAAVKAFLAVGERPANAKLDPVELAAWGSVCLALLNLDEALTRE